MTTLRSRPVVEPSSGLETPPQGAKPRRDPWLDNIKMALVTLVVVGHAWTLLPGNTFHGTAYDFLYAWHVPAFVTITGYLSRSFAWTPQKLWALVRTVAVPYVIFEAALAWFRYRVGGVTLDDLFADPHWPMWYLSALFFWRLMTPIFVAMSRTAALTLAVLISIGAGLYADNILDLARILGLLPFFVLGLKLGDREWSVVRHSRARLVAPLGFVAILAFVWLSRNWIDTEWYYYRSRYDVLEPNDLNAFAIRAMLLCVGLVGTAAFFALVPRSRSWFSTLGAATLVVYLFHGFFVLSAQYEGYGDWAADHVVSSFVLTTIAAIALAQLLAAPPVARVLTVAVDPIGWLEKRRRQLVS